MPELVEMVKATRHFETSAANYQLPNDTMTHAENLKFRLQHYVNHNIFNIFLVYSDESKFFRDNSTGGTHYAKDWELIKKIFTGTFYYVV